MSSREWIKIHIIRLLKASYPLVINPVSITLGVVIPFLGNWDTIKKIFPKPINGWEIMPNWEWYNWTILALVLVLLTTFYKGYQLAAHKFELVMELQAVSNIPNPPRGRHVVLIVRNNSPKPIKDFYITVGRYWINGIEQLNLPLHVKRQDYFDWSSWEEPEKQTKPKGKKDFDSGQERRIDIAELGQLKNQVRVALQTEYDIVGNTEGSYRIEAIIHGVYNGGKIEIPVFVDFGYKGKKDIENRINVFSANKDRRVEVLHSKVIV